MAGDAVRTDKTGGAGRTGATAGTAASGDGAAGSDNTTLLIIGAGALLLLFKMMKG